MNTLEQELRYVLRRHNIVPNKRMGQHFLIDAGVRDDIVRAAELTPREYVLEVGPGPGILTQALLGHAPNLTVIEADKRFVQVLEPLAALRADLRIVHGDVLRANIPELFCEKPYVVVANLPYQITSVFFRMMWTNPHPPKRMVVMIQKEVAQRIMAKPGQMSLLALMIQLYSDVSWVRDVSRTCFMPAPDVDSAVIRMTRRQTPIARDPEALLSIARMGFAGKRKQLHGTLAAGLHRTSAEIKQLLEGLNIDPRARPQELSVEQWERITRAVLQ